MFLKIAIPFVLLFSIGAQSGTCGDRMRLEFERELETLSQKYQLLGHPIKKEVSPYWKLPVPKKSRQEAVILVHGFIASPFEMLPLHNYYANKGYMVYSPILEGFGSSYKVANKITARKWKNSVSRAVKAVSRCYSKIHLVGFSLGGGLVTDHLLNGGYDQNGKSKAGTQIASMTLVSPYFAVSVEAENWAYEALEWFGNLKNIKVKTLYKWTGLGDLAIPVQFPQYYNQVFPMGAVSELVAFGEELRESIAQISSKYKIPSHLIISEKDTTVSISEAFASHQRLFEGGSQFVFSSENKVPHQVTFYLDIILKNGTTLREYLNQKY